MWALLGSEIPISVRFTQAIIFEGSGLDINSLVLRESLKRYETEQANTGYVIDWHQWFILITDCLLLYWNE